MDKWKTIIICAFIVVVGIVGIVDLGENSSAENSGGDKQLEYEEMPDSAYIQIPAIQSLTVTAGETEQISPLYNPEDNPCYYKVSIFLSDDTCIYESPEIYPGEELEAMTFNTELKRGKYSNCRIVYNCYSLDDNTELNSGEFIIEILSY